MMTGARQPGLHRWTKILRNESEAVIWEAVIEASGQTNATVSHRSGSHAWRIEIFDSFRSQLAGWEKQFGGTIEYLSRAQLEAMSRPPVEGKGSLLKIRDRLVVTQSTAKAELGKIRRQFPGRMVLSYPAGLAFGTGNHATTATCLRMIADFAQDRGKRPTEPWSFLDLGCGSGILCAAAKALGASEVLGVDFDEMAVRTARRLAAGNGLERSALVEGDVLKWNPGRNQAYDLIAANLFHDVLIEIFSSLPGWLKADGGLVVSGILRGQESDCLAAGEKAGFEFGRIVRKGKWSSALARLRG